MQFQYAATGRILCRVKGHYRIYALI